MRTALVLLALLAPILAGCVGDSSPEATLPAGSPEPEFGGILGLVVDDEVRPVANATVFLVDEGRKVRTGPDGSFQFDQVATGPKTLRAVAAGHAAAETRVEVKRDANVEAQLTLPVLPEYVPRNFTHIFQGKYDCAAEYLIITGDCMIVYNEFFSGYTGNESVTEEVFVFYVPIGPRWQSVVMELTWQHDGANQFDGMHLYLEHGNGSTTGHDVKVGRADGNENPLRFVVHQGEPHPQADTYETGGKAQVPAEGETAQVRVFPRGHLHDTTRTVCDSQGRCLLGVGAGLDVKFTVYATVFYNMRAPDGFTAIPG